MTIERARLLVNQISPLIEELKKELSVSSNEIRLKPGDNLQAAIDNSPEGTRLILEPGKYPVNLKLKKKNSIPIHIMSAAADDNFAVSPYINPLSYDAMPQLVPRDEFDYTVQALPNSSGYIFDRIAFDPGRFDRTLIGLGLSSSLFLSEVPDTFSFEQCIFRGDSIKGQHRGIEVNCSNLLVNQCHFSNFFEIGRDSQCILGWNTPGPITVLDSFLEASGENIMFGGARTNIHGLVPSSILIRGNHFTKNPDWRNHISQPSVKNLFEIKNARNVLLENNLFENNWVHSQTGFAILLKAEYNDEKNADGSDGTWVACENVTFQYNVIRACASGINITGSTKGLTQGTKNIQFLDNLFYSINDAFKQGGRFIQLGGSLGEIRNIEFIRNTARVTSPHSFIVLYSDTGKKIPGFVFTDNLIDEGEYGIHGQGAPGLGIGALDFYCPIYEFNRNAIIQGGVRNINYGPGNTKFSSPTTIPPIYGVNIEEIKKRIPWLVL